MPPTDDEVCVPALIGLVLGLSCVPYIRDCHRISLLRPVLLFVPFSGMERNRNTIAHLQVRNIDIGIYSTSVLILGDYLEKNNTNQKCEATMKLSTEKKWLKYLADTKYID
ncbi:hypothetical protein AVEN_72272-1 [Araneus ventricosus]|uniref:Uncharacterized protein n=1 Tax=Araneus ventricosus TaxID=182803 RepID=A0A4Y2SZ49_ARAVE|nr:hypothetical protein AVEN_72272-1 [Araneus ventricosus]